MSTESGKIKFGVILAVLALALTAVTVAEAADKGEMIIKARAVSIASISRASADLVDIRVTRLTDTDERSALVDTLVGKDNHALAAALADEPEAGWVRFDPRGGGGQGRDPRKATLRYAREIVSGDTREIILITNQYIGYGSNAQGADGSKLAQYPLSFVLLKFQKDDNGDWKGIGRIFVGAKVKFDNTKKKFVIDEFPMDPVYLKDVTLR